MKKIVFILAALAAVVMCSCNGGGNEPEITIDPVKDYVFAFDGDGVPYEQSLGTTLSAETQKKIREQVIGYGWQHLCAHAIDRTTGKLEAEDFYESRKDIYPHSYYFQNERQLVVYSYWDAIRANGYWSINVGLDYQSGKMTMNVMMFDYTMLRILNVFKKDGKWHLAVVEDGWNYVEYVRMRDDELKQAQAEYNKEYKPF